MTSLAHLLVAASLAGLPLVAAADAYRCTVNGQTSYSDLPCGTTVSVIRSAPAMQGGSNSYEARALDALFNAALAQGDFAKAESLAVTADQWQALRQAKREAAADAASAAATRRAEIDRKKQIQATLDATAAADKRAKQRTECYTTTQSFGYTGSAHTTCEPARKVGDPLPDLVR